jgi:2-polyprenyl-6-methoxyphenol hydroxylase-like FAD-dependent oxidoreductase
MGYEPPPEERIEIGLAYTTRWFRRNPGEMNGDLAAVIPPTPDGKRGGVMLAQESDRWIVTLVSHFGHPAPADLHGFREFSRSLPATFIYDVIRQAEPVGEAAGMRFPASVWRRYDRLDRFPEGYLVMGDAISSFNPRYGQGMSVAALEAIELRSALRDGARDLARRFFARTSRVVETPWTVAATNDLRMPEARGRRSPVSGFLNWYMARLLRAAHHDPALAAAFHRVANLLARPRSLMHPRIAMRVLRSGAMMPATLPPAARTAAH